jgi:hypothetical protein
MEIFLPQGHLNGNVPATRKAKKMFFGVKEDQGWINRLQQDRKTSDKL